MSADCATLITVWGSSVMPIVRGQVNALITLLPNSQYDRIVFIAQRLQQKRKEKGFYDFN